jgi:prepilin-type processing-associated H-X9-DG protein
MASMWESRRSWVRLGLVVALGCVMALAALRNGPALVARDQQGAEAKADLPADLNAVPREAAGFVSQRLADWWGSEAAKAVRERIVKEQPDALKEVEKHLGAAPADIERLTLLVDDPRGGEEPVILVSTLKPFDRAKVLTAVAQGAREELHKEKTLYVTESGHALQFLGDRAYMLGSAKALRPLAERPAPAKEGTLTPALQLAAGKHLLTAGVNPAFARDLEGQLPAEAEPFKPLLKTRYATAVLDIDDQIRLNARLVFANADQAKDAEKAVNGAIGLAQSGLAGARKMFAEQKEPPVPLDLFKTAEEALKGASVKQNEASLEVTVAVKADLKTTSVALLEGVQKVRESAARIRSQNNLKQLAIAMHNYHDKNGHFPPAAVYDKNGKPLLSWRVLLLPYLAEDQLYGEFHLDEPWDSDHNKKLLARMPKVFALNPETAASGETVYQAFVGKGTLFEGRKGTEIRGILDGTSNTIMFIEAAKTVPWSKPANLLVDAQKPLPKIGGHFSGGANAAFCDGSVRYLSDKIDEATLRALITIAGGEVIGQIP